MPAALKYEEIVVESYRGILRREPDAAASHYVSALEDGSVSLSGFFEFLTSLPEFYDRCQPSDRTAAIASLYADGLPARGNPDIFPAFDSSLIVWHFPKCAGNALKSGLASHFHPLQLGQWSGCRAKAAPAPSRQRRLFVGHMTWSEFVKLPRPATVLTLLRDPRERLESMYRYFTTIPCDRDDRYQPAVRAAKEGEASFFSPSDPAVLNVVDNGFVRDLTEAFIGTDGIDPLREKPDTFVDLAFQRVMEFDAIAFVEEIRDAQGMLPPRMAEVLRKYFGKEIGPLGVVNETTRRIAVSAGWARHLDEKTHYDRLLFARIRRALGMQ